MSDTPEKQKRVDVATERMLSYTSGKSLYGDFKPKIVLKQEDSGEDTGVKKLEVPSKE